MASKTPSAKPAAGKSASAKKKVDNVDQSLDFEAALKELEAIIERMEDKDLSLEQMLEDYERGMTLSTICQGSLEAAELRVQKLTRTASGLKTEALALPETEL